LPRAEPTSASLVDPGTVLVRTTFVIPADTTVEEFFFSGPARPSPRSWWLRQL
jgi:hypothetical protein